LCVEDNKIIQELLDALLGSWGIDFDIASNGKEAVELARLNEGKYDLCLMDTEMPVMDGFEATKIIRQNLKYFPILSTSANFTYENSLLEMGADEFISKPYDLKKLHQKIIEWTDNKAFLVKLQNNAIETRKEMPMDKKHAIEIKELKEKGLVKMRLDGPELHEVIVHQNTPNKISYDFNVKKDLMTEFLNRDPDRPTLCDLYRGQRNCVVETFLGEDEYVARMATEDEEMAKCTKKYFKSEEEE
jgi:CheY-like chemotaxis protein